MLNDSDLVRLLKPWSFRRGRGLTTSVRSPVGRTKGGIMGQTRSRGGQDSLPRGRGRPNLRASPVPPLHESEPCGPHQQLPPPYPPDGAVPRDHRTLPRPLPPPPLPAAHRGVPEIG